MSWATSAELDALLGCDLETTSMLVYADVDFHFAFHIKLVFFLQ